MEDLIEYLKSKLKNLNDIYFRELNIKGKKVYIVFSDALVDSNLVSNYVVRSIVEIITNEPVDERKNTLKDKIEEKIGINTSNIDLEDYIAINKVKKLDKEKDNLFTYILSDKFNFL